MTRIQDLPSFMVEAVDEPAHVLAEVAAALPSVLPGAVVSGRDRLFAAARGSEHRFAPFYARLAAQFDLDEAAIAAIARRSGDDSAWVPGPLPGVRLFHFDGGPRVATADCGLVEFSAGISFPDHVHVGEEAALLLQGTYLDHLGHAWRAGDVHTMAPGSHHGLLIQGERVISAVRLYGGLEIDGEPVRTG